MSDPRRCGCGCPRPLTRKQRRFASVACAHKVLRKVRPLCACGCPRRVKRMGRPYASRACASAARRGRPHPFVQRAIEANRAAATQRILASLLEQLRPHVDAEGRVSLHVAVTMLRRVRREGYRAGAGAAWQRYQRVKGRSGSHV